MPERRVNDAQVERLLHALKTDLTYRRALAAKIAKQDNIKYDSAMRRLQRYITEAGEKRSFAGAPKVYQREVRQDYREHERERQKRERRREQDLKVQDRFFERSTRQYERERERDFIDEEEEEEEEESEFDSYEVHLNDLRAVISYHDGDLKETAKALGLSRRGEQLLDFQVRADSADTQANVLNMKGGGQIEDGIRNFFNDADVDLVQEIQTFSDIFFNRPDWQIGVMLEDMRKGGTTFADWMDAWEADGFDSQAEDSEYWRVWRAAYARATA